jgi:hypothetical protein
MADTDPQTDEQPLDDVDRRLACAFSHIEQETAPDGLQAHARKLSGERATEEKAD